MSDAFDSAFGSDAGFGDDGAVAASPPAGGVRDEDPAAAFLAQQESEMAGIEGIDAADGDGFSILDAGDVPHNMGAGSDDFDLGLSGDLNGGDIYKEVNGPPGGAPRSEPLPPAQEPESLRRWREEQRERLEQLDAASRKAEAEWRDRAKKELEEWKARQGEQLEKTRRNNRVADEAFFEQPNAHVIGYMAAEDACVREREEELPGSEWERVARLCDFNPKTSKQSKDVSRMRGIIISLKQSPLVR